VAANTAVPPISMSRSKLVHTSAPPWCLTTVSVFAAYIHDVVPMIDGQKLLSPAQQNFNNHSAGGAAGFAGLGFAADFWLSMGTSND
jgi:hypothetical protein